MLTFDTPEESREFAISNGCEEIWRWLYYHFQWTEQGFLVLKTFGEYYEPEKSWLPLKPGKVIRASKVDNNKDTKCGEGINFGTSEWFNKHTTLSVRVKEDLPPSKRYGEYRIPYICLVRWQVMPNVVVPGNQTLFSYTKARTPELEIVEPVCDLADVRRATQYKKMTHDIARAKEQEDEYIRRCSDAGLRRNNRMTRVMFHRLPQYSTEEFDDRYEMQDKIKKVLKGFILNVLNTPCDSYRETDVVIANDEL